MFFVLCYFVAVAVGIASVAKKDRLMIIPFFVIGGTYGPYHPTHQQLLMLWVVVPAIALFVCWIGRRVRTR